MEYRESIDLEKSFRSFLFKIAENKAYDFFRKVSRDKKFEADLIALSTLTLSNLKNSWQMMKKRPGWIR
jgi:RNA polymerase sigma-70 factor (ECF subfamily)